jgi:acyltransferase, WS/DGAT/MGAT
MLERLNGLDEGMLAGETPEWHMHAGALLVLEPLPGHEGETARNIDAVLRARRNQLGPFRHQLLPTPLGLSPSSWVDLPDADLASRIRRVDVPKPGGAREVAAVAAELFSVPLDRKELLWEIWVLEGLQGGHAALLVKVHHALMDGLRATRLFEVLFDLVPEAPLERPDAEADPTATAPTRWTRITSTAEYLALTPIRVVRFGGELALAGARVAQVLASPAGRDATLPFRAPRTSLNRRLTPNRSFAFASANLDDMKTVKRAFNVTMNDVALAMTAHALREYLLDRDELPTRPLVAQIPVGVSKSLTGTGGNAVAATGCSLQTHIVDPVERLTAIHASMQSAKALQSAMGDDMVVDALSVIPGAALSAGLALYRGLGLDRLHPPIFNAIVSNVPGPPIALYTHGARLIAGYTFGPLLAGCALNVTMMSYRDQVDFGIATCPDVVDDPWLIAEAIPEGLDALLKRV